MILLLLTKVYESGESGHDEDGGMRMRGFGRGKTPITKTVIYWYRPSSIELLRSDP